MRKAQFSLIAFIVSLAILLSLSGIVTDRLSTQADQILKAQDALILGDIVNAIKTLQYEERQVGVDFTGVHLGSIGFWPHGLSECGTARNLTNLWLDKNIPYWKSGEESAKYYVYEGSLYAERTITNPFKVLLFENVSEGYYWLNDSNNNEINTYLLNDELVCGSPVFLTAGNHRVLLTSGNPCDFTISCDLSITGSMPASAFFKREINQDQQVCIPEFEQVKLMVEDMLNEYFDEMDQKAWQLSYDYAGLYGEIVDLQFGQVTYKARLENLSSNALYAYFYPVSVGASFFKIDLNNYANLTHQATTIVYDAFKSDAASFFSAASEVANNTVIEDMINAILSDHSYIDILASIELRGSFNQVYEQFADSGDYPLGFATRDDQLEWNVTGFSPSNLNFREFFGDLNLKPNCLYFMKETCNFFGNQTYAGFLDRYVNDGFSAYELSLDQTSLDALNDSCTDCFTESNGLCTDLNNQDCLECFSIAYTAYLEQTDDPLSAALIDYGDLDACDPCTDPNIGLPYDPVQINYVEACPSPNYPPDCLTAIRDVYGPMISDYVEYRFADLEVWLNELYGTNWKLMRNRLNLSSVAYSGISSDNNFNTSCSNCSDASLSGCESFTPNIALTDSNLSSSSPFDTFINPDSILLMGDNAELIILDFNFENTGNTIENMFNLTVSLDIGNTSFFDYVIYDNYDLDDDPNLGFTPPFNPGESLSLNGLSLFVPDNYGIGIGTHGVKVCVESWYYDEFTYSDNCHNLYFDVCSDGDFSPRCCEGTYWDAYWVDPAKAKFDFVASSPDVINKDYSVLEDGLSATIIDFSGFLELNLSGESISSVEFKVRSSGGSCNFVAGVHRADNVITLTNFVANTSFNWYTYPVFVPITYFYILQPSCPIYVDAIKVNGQYLSDLKTGCCGDDWWNGTGIGGELLLPDPGLPIGGVSIEIGTGAIVPPPGLEPVIELRLNEGSGTTIRDEGPSDFLGVIIKDGGYPAWADCVAGTCLQFNGNMGLAMIPNTPTGITGIGELSEFSIEFMIKTDKLDNLILFSKEVIGPPCKLEILSSGALSLTAPTPFAISGLGSAIADNNWHHVIITSKPGSDINVYVDGYLAGSVAGNPLLGLDYFRIGNVGPGVTPASNPFEGFIDEIKVYDVELTPEHVAALEVYTNSKFRPTIIDFNDYTLDITVNASATPVGGTASGSYCFCPEDYSAISEGAGGSCECYDVTGTNTVPTSGTSCTSNNCESIPGITYVPGTISISNCQSLGSFVWSFDCDFTEYSGTVAGTCQEDLSCDCTSPDVPANNSCASGCACYPIIFSGNFLDEWTITRMAHPNAYPSIVTSGCLSGKCLSIYDNEPSLDSPSGGAVEFPSDSVNVITPKFDTPVCKGSITYWCKPNNLDFYQCNAIFRDDANNEAARILYNGPGGDNYWRLVSGTSSDYYITETGDSGSDYSVWHKVTLEYDCEQGKVRAVIDDSYFSPWHSVKESDVGPITNVRFFSTGQGMTWLIDDFTAVPFINQPVVSQQVGETWSGPGGECVQGSWIVDEDFSEQACSLYGSGWAGGEGEMACCDSGVLDGASDNFALGVNNCVNGAWVADPDASEADCVAANGGASASWNDTRANPENYCCDDGVNDGFAESFIASTGVCDAGIWYNVSATETPCLTDANCAADGCSGYQMVDNYCSSNRYCSSTINAVTIGVCGVQCISDSTGSCTAASGKTIYCTSSTYKCRYDVFDGYLPFSAGCDGTGTVNVKCVADHPTCADTRYEMWDPGEEGWQYKGVSECSGFVSDTCGALWWHEERTEDLTCNTGKQDCNGGTDGCESSRTKCYDVYEQNTAGTYACISNTCAGWTCTTNT